MVRGAWQATVHGVAKSRTQLSDLLSLTSGHRNFVNGCKFSNNQQDGLLSGQFDEQTVIPQGELRVPGASPPSLCSGGPRHRPVQPPGLTASGSRKWAKPGKSGQRHRFSSWGRTTEPGADQTPPLTL